MPTEPPPQAPSPATTPGGARPSPIKWRLVTYAAGVVLLAAAVWALSGQGDTLRSAWQSARAAPPWMLAALLLLPLVNWLLTSGAFWVLTRRYGRVGPGEMCALIGAAWLLNYLPLKPGLIGRVAYHKAVNGIPIHVSAWVIVQAILAGVGAVVIMLLMLEVMGGLSGGGGAPFTTIESWVLLGALVALQLFGLARGSAPQGSRLDAAWRMWAATALKLADTLVWALRYWLVFSVIGHPLSLRDAAIVATASQAASLLPIQFGLREWVVGLASGTLAGAPNLLAAAGPGLAADLLNRALEICVVTPLGLVCGAWVARRVRGVRGVRGARVVGTTAPGTEPSP